MSKITVDGREVTIKQGDARIDKINSEIVEARLDKSKWEYVEIPAEDFFERPFEGIDVNGNKFGPGKHFVEPVLAGEIRQILKRWQKGQRRIMSSAPDMAARRVADQLGNSAVVGGGLQKEDI